MARVAALGSDLTSAWPDVDVECEAVYGDDEDEMVARARDLVRRGRADVALHSYDSVPLGKAEGLKAPTVPQRADPRDVLVTRGGKVFVYLPEGARIGAAGAWREAQLLRRRSDLQIVPMSGDLDSRLMRLEHGELDGLVLSAAELYWLGRLEIATEYIDTDLLIPTPGQGALALEIRAEDNRAAELLAPLDATHTAYAVRAERTCRRRLGGDKDAPVGIFATTDGETMFIHGIVATRDGSRAARLRWSGPWREADDVGTTLAELLLAIGAREILSGRPIPPTTRYALRRARVDEGWSEPYPEEEA